jgi:serine/threonine protein kinase
MEEILDVGIVCQQAVRHGLVTQAQIDEVLEEAGPAKGNLAEILRLLERKAYLTPWQSNKLIKGDFDGYFLGGYRVLYKIASGTFGRVFRADDPRSGRIVAIKVLRQRWMDNQDRIDLFAREGRVGLTLKHPNIVEILAISHDPSTGQYFIVMEFVEGDNLREILRIQQQVPVAQALKWTEEAAAGLAYAYSKGVTHRDMKLSNILISTQGSVAKLVDFGLAQVYAGAAGIEDEKENKTAKDGKDIKERLERTVDYAGLERATGVKKGDVRSDIYFLGCVLYEILTGRPPLPPTRDKYARMQRERFDNVVPMSPDEVQAPPSVFLLVETMMSLSPQRRYQTPAQLVDAIKAVRRDVEGRAAGPQHGATHVNRTLFIVEKDERMQDALRDKFKNLGYRVFIAGDPNRAADRFRQQPYDALIVDVGTVGEDGLTVFEHIMRDAANRRFPCAGIVLLADDQEQAGLRQRVTPRKNVGTLVMPVKVRQLQQTLTELFGASG